ncbi:hypothetical protein DID73_02575 [Candidatus Marinamargulisbacteria bacterium SCGC AG-343-K17]|nr:hypothetical protein DID73_02575 [Candidatus Marinamargulisbacteria bacterium SCGC AG-343-K17]
MDNLVKAKVIIELLDDRKYSVLSSFSSQELNKLNGIDLDVLNNLSNADINKTIGEFLENIEKRKDIEPEPDAPSEPSQEKSVELKGASKEKGGDSQQPVEEKKVLTIAEKIQLQPPQLLACILNRVDEEKKAVLLSHLDEDKKQLIESIEVENTPIAEQVIQVLLKELELTS